MSITTNEIMGRTFFSLSVTTVQFFLAISGLEADSSIWELSLCQHR